MPGTEIDAATFRELQATAGADFVAELVQTFAEEAQAMLAELRAAHAAAAAERFRRAAHSIKSNANTFGARRLAELARTLELGGLPADAGGLDARDRLDTLAEAIDAALAALRGLARGDGGV